jgi:hypothetical protein
VQQSKISMIAARAGEDQKSKHYRGARIYSANRHWWFETREGVQFGPFICGLAAACSLAVFIAQYAHEFGVLDKELTERPGSQDKIAHMVEEIVAVLKQHRDFSEAAATTWAKWRLEDLRNKGATTAETLGRIRVLEFSPRHPEQTSDFEYFLKCRAGLRTPHMTKRPQRDRIARGTSLLVLFFRLRRKVCEL